MVTEAAAERPALKHESRRLAATVMALLHGESGYTREPVFDAAAHVAEAVIELDPVTAPSRTEIVAVPEAPVIEAPQFIERAKEMGRGVLRLIGRVKQEVHAADVYEQSISPTNLEPLAVADADIRAAMEELVAPIEAIETPLAIAGVGQGEHTIDAAVQYAGGDREVGFLAEPKSPFARTLEVAASVATVAAREALDVKEKVFARTSVLRKAGLFALGAATAGGFAYTWDRIRSIKKEQRDLRREHKRFEVEVRAAQGREEHRLHELEVSNVQSMTRPERQQYVQEVSEFAHKRAEEIRTTARLREVVRMPEYTLEDSQYEAPRHTYERPGAQLERAGVMERAAAAPDNTKDSAGTAPLGAGVVAPPSPMQGKQPLTRQQQQPQPLPPTRRSSLGWLWGMLLGIAIMAFIFLWALRIL